MDRETLRERLDAFVNDIRRDVQLHRAHADVAYLDVRLRTPLDEALARYGSVEDAREALADEIMAAVKKTPAPASEPAPEAEKPTYADRLERLARTLYEADGLYRWDDSTLRQRIKKRALASVLIRLVKGEL